MRFFTAVSVAFAAFAGLASAQATTATPVETGVTSQPTGGADGEMGANAIISPADPSLVISAGSTFDIQWTNIVGESVTLVLVGGESDDLKVISTIATNVDNSGSFSWSIPDDIPASSSYAIRIQYDSNPNNWNYSATFGFDSDVTAAPSTVSSTAAPSTTSAPTSTEESTTESETSTESESITSSASTETETETSTTVRTSTRRSTTTSDGAEPTESSEGAPENAASSTLSSPVAIIMAVLAAALFIH